MLSSDVDVKMVEYTPIKYIDLCSGIGGFRLAIDSYSKSLPDETQNRFECVYSCDIKQDAIDTYNINFNESNKKKDMNDIDPDLLPDFDLLCAGFPCQPFSSAGNKKGFSDKRGGIIFKIVDICQKHMPSIVLLENVSNLISLENGKCIDNIKKLFENIGYFVTYKKLNILHFGCAQSRDRVYIICSKTKPVNFEDIDALTSTSERVFVRDIIDFDDTYSDIDSAFVDKILILHKNYPVFGCKMGDKRGGNQNIHSWDIDMNGDISDREKILMKKIMLERRKKHWAIQKNITWMDGMPLTFDEIGTFYKDKSHGEPKLQHMLDNLERNKYLKKEKCKELVDGKRIYKDDSELGYNICKGKLSFPISKILDPSDVSPTLTATDAHKLAIIVNDRCIRRLNTLELKRLCGFHDDFIVPSHVDAYDLFGNMASPKVLEKIIRLIYSA